MPSLLNKNRPPVFCPGCSHEKVLKALDLAFQHLGLQGHEIAMISDIGCSGLFDTFFNTHALHGLHGRALTYATGIKLAHPDLNVIVTMGDGGMGIGGAHFLSACRRNLDLTLIVLNNFNFGMTGGQFSATTPPEATVASGFLNALESPLDICEVAASAGATYVSRCSAYDKDLSIELKKAIEHKGFSVVDTLGICVGRYAKKNRLTPKSLEEKLTAMTPFKGPIPKNRRREYGELYRERASRQRHSPPPMEIDVSLEFKDKARDEIVILGDAGQRVITAGEILCIAGALSGRRVTQKNEYNITVLRGPSISEVILSADPIGFTGISRPSVVIAIGQEGVSRRSSMFRVLDENTLVLCSKGLILPETRANTITVDFKSQGIKSSDRALASLGIIAKLNRAITPEILERAIQTRFEGSLLESALGIIQRAEPPRLGNNLGQP